ncbi:MAG: hypothetical protein Q8N18_26550 [Opitutaceae bacterium]|nr:hypothetical protein [Opitutaceae bacterium]
MNISATHLSALGALFAVIGAIVSAFAAYKSSTDQAANREKLLVAAETNVTLSERNLQLSEQLQLALSGGDSYPTVAILRSVHLQDLNSLVMSLSVKGKYPLYDARINISNITTKVPTSYASDPAGFSHAIRERSIELLPSVRAVDTFSANSDVMIAVIKMDEAAQEQRFRVSVQARNGRFSQEIEMKKSEGKGWHTKGHRIFKSSTAGEVLIEEFPFGSPR